MSKRESMTDKLRRMNTERQVTEDVPELSPISEMPPSEGWISQNRLSENGIPASAIHPGPGGRCDFLKVTVTMDPDDFEAINAEMVRRKRAKEKGAQLSGCIREAIRFWRAAGMPRQE